MGQTSNIEWTDATWNPWMGCRKVSPACAHCYMFRDQIRYGRNPDDVHRAQDATFNAPMKWKEPRRIFTCSWSDFFIEESDRWRADAWNIMICGASRHTYQILTKRPERIPEIEWPCLGLSRNVWVGVSVENHRFYRRIDSLLRTDPALAFLSLEPLLGPIPDIPLAGVSWVIVGAESGPKARPTELNWIRGVRDLCQKRGVAFFMKQLCRNGRPIAFEEFPHDLQIREFPKGVGA